MTEELRIWTLGAGGGVDAVESMAGVELEDILEETLVRRPGMLEAGLHLVGRQTPTDGGRLDLLGVDADGRLVVFELKRERLTREAVTQCIDYAAALDAQGPEEIGRLISEYSGERGIEEIEDFEEWYQKRFAENDLGGLLPPRLALVGLGVDEGAERMARFLSDGGIDISVLTFFGFRHRGETLLARQVEVERDARAPSRRRTRPSAAEDRVALEARLAERGLTELFRDIASTLRAALPDSREKPGQWGIGFRLPFGGRRRGLCHLGVEEAGGARILWYANEESYSAPALEALTRQAEGLDGLPLMGGYSFRIADDESWQDVREGIVAFLTAARREWSPAPGETGGFRERVWSYVRDIPRGTVVTYGQVAEGLGVPGAAQSVGNAMSALPDETDVPWHRVVAAGGRLAADEIPEQRRRLEEEGVVVDDGDAVDLDAHQVRE